MWRQFEKERRSKAHFKLSSWWNSLYRYIQQRLTAKGACVASRLMRMRVLTKWPKSKRFIFVQTHLDLCVSRILTRPLIDLKLQRTTETSKNAFIKKNFKDSAKKKSALKKAVQCGGLTKKSKAIISYLTVSRSWSSSASLTKSVLLIIVRSARAVCLKKRKDTHSDIP